MNNASQTANCYGFIAKLLAFLTLGITPVMTIGSDACDPGLEAAGTSDIAYTQRGDRCEGIYIQEVSGGALEIVSLTEDFQNFAISKEHPLFLEWPALGKGPVRARASGLEPRLHYRMDTVRPAMPPSYLWPSDVLFRLGLSRKGIGISAWIESEVQGVTRQVYLPLRVTPQGSNSVSATGGEKANRECYAIVLMSSVELEEVYVTLRPIDLTGQAGKPIRSNAKLDLGYYPAERPIVFRIYSTELTNDQSGLYSLSVGAELKHGEARVAPEILFFHPAARKPKPRPEDGGKL